MEESFVKEFLLRLRARYGRIPSAAFVALKFNLRVQGDLQVSQESARRWLRGLSIPSPSHLSILADWLDLDLNQAFRHDSSEHFIGHQRAYERLVLMDDSQRKLIFDLIAMVGRDPKRSI